MTITSMQSAICDFPALCGLAAREGIPCPSSPQSKAPRLQRANNPPGAQVLPLLAVWAVSLTAALWCTVGTVCSTVPPSAVPGMGTGWYLNSVLRTALPYTVSGAAQARPEHLGNSY